MASVKGQASRIMRIRGCGGVSAISVKPMKEFEMSVNF